MLGLLTYPRKLDQSRLDELLALPGRFVMTVAIRFQTRAEAQDDLDLLRRRLIAGDNKATEDTADLEDAISAVAGGTGRKRHQSLVTDRPCRHAVRG